MPTIKPTSLSINPNKDELRKRLKASTQGKLASEVNLPAINQNVEILISNLNHSSLNNFTEYEDLLLAKEKVLDLSEKIKYNLEQDNQEKAQDNKELYEVWVDSLFLNYSILELKTAQKSGSQDQQNVNDLNDLTRERQVNLGLSYSEKSQISGSASNPINFNIPAYFSQLPIGICIATGEDLIFQYVNSTYLEIIDKDNSIIGNKISNILTDIDTQLVYEAITKVYRTGEPYIADEVLVKLFRYGSWQSAYFNLVCQPIREPDNSISGIVVICTEVTNIVASKKVLQESEHKFRTIIDKSPVAKTILRGPDFKVELANKRMLDFFWRRTIEEVQNRPFLEIFPELESQEFPKRLRQVFSSGVPYNENDAAVYVDGDDGRKAYIIDYEYAPLMNAEGEVDGIMVSAYDVTERVKAEQALKSSEKQFKSIASVMQQFIWTASPDGQLNYFNQAVYDFAGRSEDDLITNGWLTMVHPDDQEENVELWANSIKTGADFIFEHRFRKANGDYRWQLSRAVPQRDDNGTILQWVGTSTDIHDQIMFQETLEDLVDARTKDLSEINIDLQSSNQDLESFAYISSHDLQEPLRKIQTFISIILDSDYENLSDRGKSYFLRVESAAARMKSLITDLLAYSRTSAVDKDFEKVNLQDLLEEIQGDFIDTLEDKNGSIHVDSLPAVSGISFQLSQLFVNLISNSIKFAKEGHPPHINITNRVVTGDELSTNQTLYPNQNYIEITLKDNGIGFSQEYASKIFEVFQRLHAKGTYDGTGIGLAICKKIIDKHHGLITATSNLGEGATFTILLPLEQ